MLRLASCSKFMGAVSIFVKFDSIFSSFGGPMKFGQRIKEKLTATLAMIMIRVISLG